ncbi:hypothetical protein EBR96_03115, partial [bacterium]|nr:hypothetical protein [bacterium]
NQAAKFVKIRAVGKSIRSLGDIRAASDTGTFRPLDENGNPNNSYARIYFYSDDSVPDRLVKYRTALSNIVDSIK